MGYRNFCKDFENIENYDKAKADNFKGWICHHRLETHNSDGERRSVDVTYKELIALDMYLNRPAEELIFLTVSEHAKLHNGSEEHRRKNSEAHKGILKGRHYYNNGKINVCRYECPPGFVPGRLPRSAI